MSDGAAFFLGGFLGWLLFEAGLGWFRLRAAKRAEKRKAQDSWQALQVKTTVPPPMHVVVAQHSTAPADAKAVTKRIRTKAAQKRGKK